MVSQGSTRLGRFSAAAIRFGRTRTAHVAGRLLAVSFVVFLGVRLAQLWQRDPVDLSDINVAVAAAAIATSAVAVASYGVVWIIIVRWLDVPASARWLTLFFKSQLGKYIPGSVWQYAGRVGLGRRYGLPTAEGLASIAVEVVASSLAAGVAGLLVLPDRGTAAAGLVIAAGVASAGLLVARRYRGRIALLLRTRVGIDGGLASSSLRIGPWSVALYLLVWAAYGAAFWLTARALFAVPVSDLPRYIGAFSLAWLAGFVAVFAPGGVGVREAVIVGLLGSRLGEANAIVLAATSRIVLTTIDLVAGGVSLVVPVEDARRPRELAPRG
jgi:hypothetical protein